MCVNLPGKSTVLKLLAGDMYLDEGDVFVLNEEGRELVRTNAGRTRKALDETKKQTSTFKRLGQSSRQSSKQARESSHDQDTDDADIRTRPLISEAVQVGYCPQFDPLWEHFTVGQNLRLFAHLRGVRSYKINGLISEVVKQLNLESLVNVRVHKLGYLHACGYTLNS